ncbi:MAG: ABC transporter ATP-binding protein [Clostridiaceae bacterium]|nr:ABC transporter ATP-binding protein [Clostridiaceae bacterium]
MTSKKHSHPNAPETRVLWLLWQRIRSFRRLLALVIFAAVAGNGFVLLSPLLTGLAIDKMIGPGQVDWPGLIRLLVIFLGTALAGSTLQKLLFNTTVKIAAGVTQQLRTELAEHVDKMPLSEIDKRESSNVASLLTHDLNAVSEGLITGLSQAFGGIVTLVGTLFLMLRLHAGVTVIMLVLTPLSFLISGRIAAAARRQYQLESAKNAELRQVAEEAAGQLELLHSFDARDDFTDKLKSLNRELYVFGQKAQFYSSLSNPVTRLINASAYILAAVVSGILAAGGALSTGNVASLLGYSMQFSRPVNEITSVAAQLQSALAGAGRIFSLLRTETEKPDTPQMPVMQVQGGSFVMNDVDFSYYPGQNLIRDLDLFVPAGSQVAVAGPTGAGKTTLINLLLRFYDIDSGDIRIDDQSIYDVSRSSLRRSFGMVLQDSWLFAGTISENIAFARPEATVEEIHEAARSAGAHSFISRLPEGYDTRIEAESDRLSAGQKQLICIARTMLADPPILILDEATSNVDTYTEKKIQKAFRRLMDGRTSFVIAHRLSTILDSDLILVMDKGQIIEQGSHDELLAADGFYASLFQAQYAGRET